MESKPGVAMQVCRNRVELLNHFKCVIRQVIVFTMRIRLLCHLPSWSIVQPGKHMSPSSYKTSCSQPHVVGCLQLISSLLLCRVLATSSEDGLIECIPSVAMARVLADHKTIQRYFAIHNPDASGTLAPAILIRYWFCCRFGGNDMQADVKRL